MEIYSHLRKTGSVSDYAAGCCLYREGEAPRHIDSFNDKQRKTLMERMMELTPSFFFDEEEI